MIISATIASGIVRDMPKVATKGVVQTTERALTKELPQLPQVWNNIKIHLLL
jgi:hypothetical protein